MSESQLSYQDVDLVPKYSELESRDKADTTVEFLGRKFNLPVIPANMIDVINFDIAYDLSESGFFYIYHRFDNQLDHLRCCNSNNWCLISISVGVNEPDRKFLLQASQEDLRVDYITIDVAHGHHEKVQWMLHYIKDKFPKTKVIAGNVATREAVDDLESWGADAIKVGIGGGSICTTRQQTGFHVPMFSCVLDCTSDIYWSEGKKAPKLELKPVNVPIIADGGIQFFGDNAKALVAGATMTMCGSLFAFCSDSPAKVVSGKKQYRGSTSFEAKKRNHHVEGRMIEMEYTVTVEERLYEIQQALQSSISYAGGKDLSAFNSVEWQVHK